MSEPKITVLDDPESLFVHAAEELAHFAGEAICSHGEFRLCLSGGSTPEAIYELLAVRFKLSIDWKEVQFFWGDERCVPPDSEQSNYGMAARKLLSKLELKDSQIHRMRGEIDPEQASREYEEQMRAVFALDEAEVPRFHTMMLGLGDNAHTASLFPGSPAIHETHRLAVAVDVDAVPRRRISLSPPVLNASERVLFVVSGAAKAEAVYNVLRGPRDPDRYPAQIVAPEDGELLWLLDKAAANRL